MITKFQHFSQKKALEVLIWIAWEWPGITPFFVCKVLYFADKGHLNDCGRPVLGDSYIAMENGPVPSFVYDLIKEANVDEDTKSDLSRIDEDIKSDLNKSLEIGKDLKIKTLRKPERDYLSGSDLYFLTESLKHCKKIPFKQLSKETHEHLAWKNAWGKKRTKKGHPIDYEDMVEEDNPLKDEILQAARDNSHSLLFAS